MKTKRPYTKPTLIIITSNETNGGINPAVSEGGAIQNVTGTTPIMVYYTTGPNTFSAAMFGTCGIAVGATKYNGATFGAGSIS